MSNEKPILTILRSITFGCLVLIGCTLPVMAYGGPGTGLPALGTLFGMVMAILFSIVGFVWYPIKRFIRFLMRQKADDE